MNDKKGVQELEEMTGELKLKSLAIKTSQDLNKEEMEMSREEVLAAIIKNYEQHKKEVEQARAGYFMEVQERIEMLQTSMEQNPDGFDHDESFKHLRKPVEYSERYEEIIMMLKMLHCDFIRISMEQYRNWVRDQWAWKREYHLHNSVHIAKSLGG